MSTGSSRSILAPLTTTFTPSPQCSFWGASNGLSSTETYRQGQACSSGIIEDNIACWPPALVTAPNSSLQGLGFYSPGLICPNGYTSACTAALSANGAPSSLQSGTSFDFQFALTAGETAIGCCPLGLTCHASSSVQTCQEVVTSTNLPAVGFCSDFATTYNFLQSIEIGSAYTPNGNSNTTITIIAASLYAPLIQLVFKSTDSTDLPNPTTPTSSSNLGTTAQTSNVYDGGAKATQSNGLSTGAKIGIGVGVPFGVLLLAAIATFILLRQKRMHKHGRSPKNSCASATRDEKVARMEKDPSGLHRSGIIQELPGNNKDREGQSHNYELDSTPRIELLAEESGEYCSRQRETRATELDAEQEE